MMSNFFLGRDAFIDFSISVTGIVIVIPALLWLFFGKKSSINQARFKPFHAIKNTLSWFVLITIGILVAPISSFIINKMLGSVPLSEAFIVIPTALITVFTFIHLTNTLQIKGKRWVGATICLSILIIVSSSIPLRYAYPIGIKPIHNTMKIDPEVYQICEIVGSNKVLLPKEILGQIGEFDSNTQAIPMTNLTHDETNSMEVIKAAVAADYAIVVINKAYDSIAFDWFLYIKIAETEHYVIYQRSE